MAGTRLTGATVFDGIEGAYERVRPTYAIDALLTSLLLAGAGDLGDVADVAAGTGKLTRLLEPHATSLVAIEPSPAMRQAFSLALPDIEVRAGHAEQLPLDDASVDLVTVGEAFHWFRPVPALAEIARVLRPGGALVVAANEWRSDAAPWLTKIFSIRPAARRPRRPGRNWRRSLERSEQFEPFAEAAQAHEQPLTHEGFIDLIRSMSHTNALGETERDAYIAELRELLATLTADPLIVPIRTRAVAARRRA